MPGLRPTPFPSPPPRLPALDGTLNLAVGYQRLRLAPGDSRYTSNPLRVCCWTALRLTSPPSPLPRGSSLCGIPQAGREGIATARLQIARLLLPSLDLLQPPLDYYYLYFFYPYPKYPQ
ncbi:uncharacterized protein LOC122320318 [Drosophila ficusphila]|uniref:uncharacterized protein LOC122320318 n=1 Tax=Drosophila ficusphila TaxID=30025 RepID=UPI001C8989CB|nr:uncharacterized protein LOC122320318 [Drosophila ficusphila]